MGYKEELPNWFCTFLCGGAGGVDRAGEEVSRQVTTNNTTTQHKKKIQHCLPLMAARPHCLTPRSHNSKASGSSSILASKPLAGSTRCNVQTLAGGGGGRKAGMWAEHIENINHQVCIQHAHSICIACTAGYQCYPEALHNLYKHTPNSNNLGAPHPPL